MKTVGKDGLRHQIKVKIAELEELLAHSEYADSNMHSIHVSDDITGLYKRENNFKNSFENTIRYIERLQHAVLNLMLILEFVELTPPDSIERFMNNETFFTSSFEELLKSLEGMTTK